MTSNGYQKYPDSIWRESGGLSGGNNALAESRCRYVSHMKMREEGRETRLSEGTSKREEALIAWSKKHISQIFTKYS